MSDRDDEESSRKVGRPTKYDEHCIRIAKSMTELGATDKEVAVALGIDVSTLYVWKHTYQQFSEALKAGKEFADDRVEASLYNRAVGYTYTANKVFYNYKLDDSRVVPYDETQHPDTTAAIFWLKNRRPDVYREQSRPTDDEALTDEQRVDEISSIINSARKRSPGSSPEE